MNSAHSHERFTEAAALERLLQGRLEGEVRFDEGTRAIYSTDSSNYRQVPIGVVTPKTIDDVVATVEICRRLGAPLLARGAGTSLAGQACNVAVVIDFSRHLRRVLALDPVARTALVEPGIVLDDLRREAERFQLTFAPDPATHNRCTLGGMIGNNSCGVHALMGGKTVDNIAELELLLYDGTRLRVGATGEDELAAIVAAGGRRGEIYAGLRRLRDEYASLIRQRFPKIPRRVSGYNLDELLPENGFNVARALVGSEGTCVTVLGALCQLRPSPQHRRLVVLGFENAFSAADYVPAVLRHHPIGLEGFDRRLVDNMRRKRLALPDIELLPPGGGFLLCEFGANDAEEAEALAARFLQAATNSNRVGEARGYSADEAARIWKVRESALGASVFVPGEPHGWEGWEDAAVPPERLGSYLRDIDALMDRYGYQSPMYGHFGQGCVHLRINFDLESVPGVARYRAFIDEAADICIRHGGSISGEHGDGQARAALLPKMFGPELMRALAAFKAIWDPDNRMNPGKLVDPVAVYEATDNLRFGPGHVPARPATYFSYLADAGALGEATARCVGVGACRKRDGGTMCPSYMATLEERHSTRGRARLLWEMLHRDLIPDGWNNARVKEALDLCLSCKACKTECPTSVDMASWKAEFFAHHYQGRRRPLGHYAFGFMDRWAQLGAPAAGLANALVQAPALGPALKRLLGVAPQRRLPALASRDFRRTFLAARPAASAGPAPPALLWADTWNNYFHPRALQAAAQLLGDAGFALTVHPRHLCCGRPLYDFGFLKQARAYLRRILDQLAPQIDAGIPVIMLEPSCASVFKDELLNFFPNDPRAQRLSRQTLLLAEALASRTDWEPPNLAGRRVIVQGHCHQKSVLSMDADLELLRRGGAAVTLLDAGCCGMAGPFGFERHSYGVSQAIAERALLPAIRAEGADGIIVANGFSCREQVAQNSSVRAVHLAEALLAGSGR